MGLEIILHALVPPSLLSCSLDENQPFLRGKSGLKLMCVFCLEELSPKWFNMMKLVAFTAFLLYCNRVALQIILKNYVLHELA